ncbi:MAG: DNA-processing protein DprA [Candidatus Andersenbacteria bacterium]
MLSRSAILKKSGIKVICRDQRDFPPQLRLIAEPPALLYIQGDPSVLLRPSVSVVGSRQASEYGKRQTRQFTDYLAKRGVVIVSGLAYGIDLTAHQTAISSGPSVAVIAGGLDVALMSWQEELAKKIIRAGGAIVSEYAPGEPALKYHFPERNRIIAGLSPVTLVSEAREHSGALITARLAVESGRTLMCIPHDLERSTAQGSNRLLRDGANVAIAPQDVLQELTRHLSEQEALELSKADPSPAAGILKALKKPHSVEDLVTEMQRSAGALLTELTELELSGKIKRLTDGRFARVESE